MASIYSSISQKGMTARSIATNMEDYEAARSGFFVLEVADLSNLIKQNFTRGINDDGVEFMNEASVKEILRLNIVKSPVPTYSVETLQYTRGNDVVHFAGKPTFDSGSFTVDDVVGVDTKSILMAWLRLAYDPHTFKGGRMKDYKKTCTLMEYTQDYELVRTWTLYGVFITGLSEGEFDKENDGKRQITANFVYDFAIMESEIEKNKEGQV